MAHEPRYQPGTQGSLLGCFAAAVFTAVAAFPLLFVLAWTGNHCDPVPQCRRWAERAFALELAVILLLAGLLGFAVRALWRWSAVRRIDPAAAGRPPAWAMATIAVLALGVAVLLSGFWI
jgi:hypothetical protein